MTDKPSTTLSTEVKHSPPSSTTESKQPSELEQYIMKWTTSKVTNSDLLYHHPGDSKYERSHKGYIINIGNIAWPMMMDYGRTCTLASIVSGLPSKNITVVLPTLHYRYKFLDFLKRLVDQKTLTVYNKEMLVYGGTTVYATNELGRGWAPIAPDTILVTFGYNPIVDTISKVKNPITNTISVIFPE
jgi:hypothetical protein